MRDEELFKNKTDEMIESQKILEEYMQTRPLLKGKTGTTIQKRFKKLLALELGR